VTVTGVGHDLEAGQGKFGHEGPYLMSIFSIKGVQHAIVGPDINHLPTEFVIVVERTIRWFSHESIGLAHHNGGGVNNVSQHPALAIPQTGNFFSSGPISQVSSLTVEGHIHVGL